MKELLLKLHNSTKLKKAFEYINLCLFFLICFISLALYAVKPFNFVNIGLFGLFMGVTLIYLIIYKPKLKFDIILLCLSVILVNMLITYIVTGFIHFSKTPVLMVIMSAVLYLWMQNKKDKLNTYFLIMLIASWCFLMVFAVFERESLFHFSISSSNRAGSHLGNENDIARHLAITIILNLYFVIINKKKVLKILSSVMGLMALYFLFLTGSISNLLLIIVVFLVAIIYTIPKKMKLWTTIGLLGIVAVFIIVLFAFPQLEYFRKRILGIISALFNVGETRADGSTAERLGGALVGFQLFIESPLFGNGFESVYREYTIMAHNNVAEIAADYGMFALVFEEALLFYPLVNLKRIKKENRIFVISMSIYIILLQFFLVIFNSKVESLFIPFLYLCLEKEPISDPVVEGSKTTRSQGKLRIVELIPQLFPIGGAERFVSDLSISLSKKTEDVELLVINLYGDNGNPAIKELKDNGINIVFLGKKRGIDFKCARSLKKVLKDFKPDIVHAHVASVTTLFLSGIYKKYNVVYTYHTIANKESNGNIHSPSNALLRLMIRRGHIKPVAISDIVKTSVNDYYKLNSETDIRTIYNGVPINKFANELSLDKRKNDFIYIGRMIPLKNVLKILEAFKVVQQTRPFVSLTLIGIGEQLEECVTYAANCGLNNVRFLGFQADVSEHLKQSKFLVMASEYEGNPIVINEAIASKCFVISTSVGGIPDVVNENNGLLYSKDNIVEELSNAMLYCIKNSKKISKLLEDNYEGNLKCVSMDKTAKEYLEYFEELCQKS